MVTGTLGLLELEIADTSADPLRTGLRDLSQSGADEKLKEHRYRMPSSDVVLICLKSSPQALTQ